MERNTRARVLVVDDAIFMRRLLTEILVKQGHEVVAEAVNGKEAAEQYRKTKPDIVTMDIVMPEMGGIEAVKEIISQDRDARILMVSAMGQQHLVLEAIQAGAKDFIVKPFESSRVLSAIDRLLEQMDQRIGKS